ncbi:MAG: tRNA uridine-5-carboxymethylaminomethyl(34) synthesis GTPase MnmE [Alphaproteobacteria bacterium]|nr:tRNA uridine-5-carboxymethylaminomethyl(34) synthesis GTPase MnmE [Alphaproteobacteria bacterium]
MTDTIFALASGAGRAGVAVIRVSGPQSWDSLKALTTTKYIKARAAHYTALEHKNIVLDQGVVVPFKGPASYTGEDVVEYYVHGGRAVIDSVLAALADQDNHRMAEPGEFTRRAFENGKLDLTEAEAVADLIDAQTEMQKQQALQQLGGGLSALYARWAETLKKTLAHLEADIEFPDEDLPDGIAPEVTDAIKKLEVEIEDHLSDNRRGERLRDGIQVAVIGAPNAGKSSLVNALVQRDVAITSETAGTTRDVIEAHLDIGGYPVILADTAGLRPDQIGEEGQEAIEGEGIKRALQRAEDADITLLIFDGTEDMPDPHTLNLIDERAILVTNKMDAEGAKSQIDTAISISAASGEGLQDLLDVVLEKISQFMGSRETPSLTRQRHRAHLQEALGCLQRSQEASLPELMAEDVRLAMRSLGKITGKVNVEDLLDVIFNDFCIGK